MIAKLETLAETEFEVLLANTTVWNPICLIELTTPRRRAFVADLIDRL